jgi:hypothetical protein
LEEQSQAKSNKAKMPTTLTNRSILAVNLLEAHHTGFALLSLPNKPFILWILVTPLTNSRYRLQPVV